MVEIAVMSKNLPCNLGARLPSGAESDGTNAICDDRNPLNPIDKVRPQQL